MSKSTKIIAALAVLLALALPLAAQTSQNEVIGGDEAALRYFINYFVSLYQPPDAPTTVHIGAVPDSMPFEVPIPEDAKVVGSIDYHADENDYPRPNQVFYESDMSPQDIAAFYTANLSPDFVFPAGMGPQVQGGFVANNTPLYLQYCYKQNEGTLAISTAPYNGVTRVTLDIGGTSVAQFMCASTEGIPPDMGAYGLLPALTAPEGVQIRVGFSSLGTGGGGGGGQEAQSTATLISDSVDGAGLVTYYSAELEKLSWTIVNSSSEANGGWLTFTLTDDKNQTWGGMLTLVKSPLAENNYNAFLAVFRTE